MAVYLIGLSTMIERSQLLRRCGFPCLDLLHGTLLTSCRDPDSAKSHPFANAFPEANLFNAIGSFPRGERGLGSFFPDEHAIQVQKSFSRSKFAVHIIKRISPFCTVPFKRRKVMCCYSRR